MPWRPLPRIAFAVAVYPFQPASPADLPLELGDELYIIEQGGANGSWYRGYLVAQPSLLAGLTTTKGQTLEARVFSGIFPKCCVEVREILGEAIPQTPLSPNLPNSEAIYGLDNCFADRVLGSPDSGSASNGDTQEVRSVESKTGSIIRRASSRQQGGLSRSGSKRVNQLSRSRSIKQDENERRQSQRSVFSGLPLTPISISPRDQDLPKPPAPVPMLKIGDETPTSSSEPLVDEIASCLREWHSKYLHELLLSRQYSTLDKVKDLVEVLDLSRRQLLHNVLTASERETLRESAVWNLVRGNKMLGGEVVVRDPVQRGRLLTGDDSAVEVMKLQSMMSLLENRPDHHPDLINLHHLLVDVKGVVCTKAGPSTMELYLCVRATDGSIKPVSEIFMIDIPAPESLHSLSKINKTKTLFKDLSSLDINEASLADMALYLVVRIQAKYPPRQNSHHSHLKPRPSYDASTPTRSVSTREASGSVGSKSGRKRLLWNHRTNTEGGSPTTLGYLESPPASRDSAKSRDLQVQGKSASTSASSQKDSSMLYRTSGVGVLDISSLMRQDKEAEQIVNIWAAADGTGKELIDPDPILHDLLKNPAGKYSTSERISRVHLKLHPFTGADISQIIRKTPTLLQGITQTRKMGFSGTPTETRSDIYITLCEPFLPLHSVLSHPNGPVTVSQDIGASNLQLTLEVRKATGERVPRCIFPSSNSSGHTAWRTTATERGGVWDQSIRLEIPEKDVASSHLIMSIADAPGFPFALAWMPLWTQNAFLRDGDYSLLLYSYDKVTSNTENGRGAYLDLPWTVRQKTVENSMTVSLASLHLRTYLCSTEFTQDPTLLGLLKWREQPAGQVLELLNRVAFVPEVEIVKLLNDVLDSLFGILVCHAGADEYEDLVFSSLITVLTLVHDRRFNLGPFLDDYIEQKFDFPFANPCLMRSYHRFLANAAGASTSRVLRAAFKVGDYVLKFIMKSRDQQKVKEEGIGITKTQETFYHNLQLLFEGLQTLMKNPASILVGSKTLIVQYFHNWLPPLLESLGKEEILQIATEFMDACENVTGKLVLYKLLLVQNLLNLDTFSTDDVRQKLVDKTVAWLAHYWYPTEANEHWKSQTRLCCSVVATLVSDTTVDISGYLPYIVKAYCTILDTGIREKSSFSLLFPKTYPFQSKATSTPAKFDEALIELSAILAAYSKRSSGFNVILPPSDFEKFLFQSLRAHRSIIDCDAYPRTWLSAYIYQHRSALQNLEDIAAIMMKSFVPSPEEADQFNTDLWRDFFTTLLRLVSSDTLALETFPEQKRRVVWKIAGDIREQGAELLNKTWKVLGWEMSPEDHEYYGFDKTGGYQVQYVPALVPQILELCLSVHEGLRHVAVEILGSMIASEWMLGQDLSMIETAVIEGLDYIFKTKRLSESVFQKLFITELLDLFEHLATRPDDPLWASLTEMVDTLDELLDLMVAVHGNESTDSFQIMNTLRLMEFLKDMQKEDIFIRYVHQLARLQMDSRNPTEAGLALKLHADLYDWDPTRLLPQLVDPPMPEQSSFDRKEKLYFEMIQCFEDGNSWDNALQTYKELARQYEDYVFDYSKLARANRAMAKIYEGIAREEAQVAKYFRVSFRGLGFPVGLRGKQFIFEGLPGERFGAFTDRMQKTYPSAQIIPAGDVQDLEGQFLQIFSVSPVKDMQHPVYRRARLPHSVREYLVLSRPQRFSTTSHRQGDAINVKEQWFTKTVYTAADAFPTILRKSEIVDIEELTLTPLETAVERIWRKNQELTALEQRASEGDNICLTNLIDSLKASVDPDSSTSVSRYRVFLPIQEEPNDANPDPEIIEYAPLEESLKVALIDHANTVTRCLSLLARSGYQTTQMDLQRDFEMTFGPEIETLSPDQMPFTPRQKQWYPASPITTSIGPLSIHESDDIIVSSPDQESQMQILHPEKHGHRLSLNFLKRNQAKYSESKSLDIPETQYEETDTASEITSARSMKADIKRATIAAFSRTDDASLNLRGKTSRDGYSQHMRNHSSNDGHSIMGDNYSSGGKKLVVKKRMSMFGMGKKKSGAANVKIQSVLKE